MSCKDFPSYLKKGLRMNGSQVIGTALASTQHIVNWYVSDLSDADLLVRPTAGANHIAWQLGHLIASETRLVRSQLPDASYPGLPAGFAEQHAQGDGDPGATQGISRQTTICRSLQPSP